MALQFGRTCAMQYLWQITGNTAVTGTAGWTLTVYGGTQPSADNLTANWVSQSYNSTFLLHWTGVSLAQYETNVTSTGRLIQLGSTPSSVSSYNSIITTATWGVLWPGSVSQATLLAATSAPPNTKYIVVPVSDLSGNGVVRLYATSIAPATSYSLQDIVMNMDISNFFN